MSDGTDFLSILSVTDSATDNTGEYHLTMSDGTDFLPILFCNHSTTTYSTDNFLTNTKTKHVILGEDVVV